MPTKCTPVLAGIDPQNARQEWINKNNVELSGLLDQLNKNMAQYNFYFRQLEALDPSFTRLLGKSRIGAGEFNRTELIRFVNGNAIDLLATLDNFAANEFANNSEGIGGEYFTRAILLKTNPDLNQANYNQIFKDAGVFARHERDYKPGYHTFTSDEVDKYEKMVEVISEVYNDVKPKLEALFNEYSLLTICL